MIKGDGIFGMVNEATIHSRNTLHMVLYPEAVVVTSPYAQHNWIGGHHSRLIVHLLNGGADAFFKAQSAHV